MELPLIVVTGLVALATAVGFTVRSQTGRVRRVSRDLDLPAGVALGAQATLLQFSTEVCSPCRATHTVLDSIATSTPGVAHIDLDLTHRPELAQQYNILQTPTTLILDSTGTVRARIGGAVKRDVVRTELERISTAAETARALAVSTR